MSARISVPQMIMGQLLRPPVMGRRIINPPVRQFSATQSISSPELEPPKQSFHKQESNKGSDDKEKQSNSGSKQRWGQWYEKTGAKILATAAGTATFLATYGNAKLQHEVRQSRAQVQLHEDLQNKRMAYDQLMLELQERRLDKEHQILQLLQQRVDTMENSFHKFIGKSHSKKD